MLETRGVARQCWHGCGLHLTAAGSTCRNQQAFSCGLLLGLSCLSLTCCAGEQRPPAAGAAAGDQRGVHKPDGAADAPEPRIRHPAADRQQGCVPASCQHSAALLTPDPSVPESSASSCVLQMADTQLDEDDSPKQLYTWRCRLLWGRHCQAQCAGAAVLMPLECWPCCCR